MRSETRPCICLICGYRQTIRRGTTCPECGESSMVEDTHPDSNASKEGMMSPVQEIAAELRFHADRLADLAAWANLPNGYSDSIVAAVSILRQTANAIAPIVGKKAS